MGTVREGHEGTAYFNFYFCSHFYYFYPVSVPPFLFRFLSLFPHLCFFPGCPFQPPPSPHRPATPAGRIVLIIPLTRLHAVSILTSKRVTGLCTLTYLWPDGVHTCKYPTRAQSHVLPLFGNNKALKCTFSSELSNLSTARSCHLAHLSRAEPSRAELSCIL